MADQQRNQPLLIHQLRYQVHLPVAPYRATMSSMSFNDFLATLDALETRILEALKGGTIQAKAADLWKELVSHCLLGI